MTRLVIPEFAEQIAEQDKFVRQFLKSENKRVQRIAKQEGKQGNLNVAKTTRIWNQRRRGGRRRTERLKPLKMDIVQAVESMESDPDTDMNGACAAAKRIFAPSSDEEESIELCVTPSLHHVLKLMTLTIGSLQRCQGPSRSLEISSEIGTPNGYYGQGRPQLRMWRLCKEETWLHSL